MAYNIEKKTVKNFKGQKQEYNSDNKKIYLTF